MAQVTHIRSLASCCRTSPLPPLPRLQNGALWRDVSWLLPQIPAGWPGVRGLKHGGTPARVGKAECKQVKAPPEAAFVHLLRGCKALPPSSDTGIRWWLGQSLWSPALLGLGVLCWGYGQGTQTQSIAYAWDIQKGPLLERTESCSANTKLSVAALSLECCNALGQDLKFRGDFRRKKPGFSQLYVPFCFLVPRHALGCLWWVERLRKFCLEG